MESEKPLGISFLAAVAVDSVKPRGIAIPAARTVAADAFLLTRTLSGTFSAGSVPIRAPLTLDDDDDSGSVTDERNSASSDASSYSRGLDSGTDDVLGDADDETELEDVIMGGIRVHRLLGDNLGGDIGAGSDFSGGSVIYRPFASDIEEETSVNYSSLEEESDNSDEVERVSESEVSEADIVSMKAKVVIPRAILSLDDDEFDEILGSDDEEAALVRVTKDSGDEETEVEDRTLRFGDMGMVDELECSDSVIGDVVSTEEEAVRMNYSDELDNGLMSCRNIDEQSLSVTPGDSNDIMGESEENFLGVSMGLGNNSKQIIEKGVVQRIIVKNDSGGPGGSIHELSALMKPCDVEGIEDSAVESGEMEITDTPECAGSVTGELISTVEDMVQVKFSDGGLVSVETSLDGVPGDCIDFQVESEGNAVDADRELDGFSQLVEQGLGHGSISEESSNRIDDDSSSEANEFMILGEGSIGLGNRESGDEITGTMIGESKEHLDCRAVSKLEKPGCEGEPEISMSSESFQLTPTLDSVTTRNLEVAGGTDVVSGCGSSYQNAEHRASEDIDKKFSLLDEDRASSLRSSFETPNESPKNEEQVSEQINKQVRIQVDSEPKQTAAGIEETRLLSLKDAERTMPENSSVIACDTVENEARMARLIHNHTFMELDKHKRTGDTMEKLSKSTFRNYSEELPSDHSVQLISEKVKERVERTQFLKEKLQRIIRRTGHCSENSAVTEVVSKLSLAGGKHQTFVGLDYVSDGTKIMLPEHEFLGDLDFSVNILVIGKTGVGKSATVNSIFRETKSAVGAFEVTTKSANYVVGNVGGILVRILDTPGLVLPATEERFNQEVLMSIKKSMRMFPVDVILYIDRLDENPDIRLLRIITSSLGSSIWQNAIVVLTHAASDVPDSSSYKDFIALRSSLMHQSIRQAVPELSCIDRSKMPGIVLAENNMSSFCGNKTSKSTCLDWRLNLLILCCSVKIQSKAGSLQKQNTVVVEKACVFGSQPRSFTLFCTLWNVLVHGANSGYTFDLHDDLEKKMHLLDSYPEILWDEQTQECLEQETLPVKNQEPEDKERRHGKEKINKGLGEGIVLGRVRARRRLGFQATKRFGIYLDTSDLHAGFSIGSRNRREEKQEEGKVLVRMRGSMAVLGLVPMLMSVLTSVYGRKSI